MMAGQIAADEVSGVICADEITTFWGIRTRLCSMAAPEGRRKDIYPDSCRRCQGCAYGMQLLKLIEEGKIKP